MRSLTMLALAFAVFVVPASKADYSIDAAARQYAADISAILERHSGTKKTSGASPSTSERAVLLNPKTKIELISAPGTHWVGDGFKVHGMFGYHEGALARSPFLMLDYAQAHYFAPNLGSPKGVGSHPHKGFETVTIAYQGQVTHRDSHGGGGTIGSGDCQWMTAGSGLQHEEFHSEEFGRTGGVFEMMQLWVNLPKKHKETKPRYQAILNNTVPAVPLYPVGSDRATSEQIGVVRVFAGEFGGHVGPANTFSPMNVWDVRLKVPVTSASTTTKINLAGLPSVDLPQPEGWSTLVSVMQGSIAINGIRVNAHQLLHLTNEGTGVRITPLPSAKSATSTDEIKLLFLAGEPLNEPVVGHGPFVMNTQQEIEQAFAQFRAGRF
eukprot:GILI01016855.1.p1 GENE.GILI01016855.1~~GILI01016855.1.p1  ORF type:complete len:381 (+),score=50.59 GILI01016855.1:75-1217(+)